MATVPAFGQADLTNCDREPIHVPGSIQPYGVLLALDPRELTIEQVAGDTQRVFGLDARALLGVPLDGILGTAVAARIADIASRDGELPRSHVLSGVMQTGDGMAQDAIVHLSDGVAILDLVPRIAEDEEPLAIVQGMLASTRGIRSEGAFHEALARAVHDATGYDRVLVYRFGPDGSGEVVAEMRHPAMESLLGLHYPASDVPKQARELYCKNWLRLIPDGGYAASPIVPAENPRTGRALDLSHSVLRSVSPLHLAYIANMGVVATLTLSIVIGGELWGMIACHHRTPRMLDVSRRVACELFAQMASLQLEARIETDRASERLRCRDVTAALLRSADRDGLDKGLIGGWPNLQDLICADGVAFWRRGEVTSLGATPSSAQIGEVVAWLGSQTRPPVFATDELALLDPSFLGLADVAAGILAVAISPQRDDYLIWFRAETIRSVTWAGNPHKPVEMNGDTASLSPRTSFEAWRETVRLRSAPWTLVQIEAAQALRASLLEVVLQHLDEVLREREKAQAQQDLLMAELDHRVKNTLATIQALVTLSSKTAESLADFTVSFQQRLHAMAKAHTRIAENRWQGVVLARLIEDQLDVASPAADGAWSLTGPDVVLTPQIGLALSLALSELAGNAVEHGSFSVSSGRVDVAWTVEPSEDGDALLLTWTESGGPPVEATRPAGFGRTLIERSLAHDVNGRVQLDFRRSGLVCTLAMPLLPTQRRQAGESAPDPAPAPRVLVVEDNALVALEVESILSDSGHEVVGPAGRVSDALRMVSQERFDIALLDVDLHGERVWPVADALAAQGVPFAFTTGFRREIVLPERFTTVEVLGKPYREADLLALAKRLVARATGTEPPSPA
jgi:chemotaxis family two-component system sensor kinase Cph1